MLLNDELKRTISDFLCTECKKPLYFELESKEDVCVNPKCILYSRLKFHDVTRAKILEEQVRDKESELKLRISRTEKLSFTSFLHHERRATIKRLLSQGRTQFERILVIDELLILANSLGFVGRKRSISHFQKILKNYTWLFRVKNQIEDIENLRNLLSVENKVYMLKYWTAIMELYKSYGIISGATGLADVFKWYEIDHQVKEKVEFRPGIAMEKIFEQMFDTITALKYLLERHYRTAKQHSYDPTSLDIAVLLGLFFSVTKEVELWSRKDLQRHYQRTAESQDVFQGDFKSFTEKYVTSKRVAPLIVFDGTSYLLDKESLLFYITYLVGQHRRKVEKQRATGEGIIVKKKQQASEVFENYIRKHLKDCGFKGPDQPLVISEQNEKHEYDVIGVKENQRVIFMVEAKYRDLPPSSLTGKTLIQQELFDDDNGLLVEAIRHQQRLDFFHKYADRFKRELSLESPSDEYQVHAWIVTKQIPLISKYRQVSILTYDDFCSRTSSSM